MYLNNFVGFRCKKELYVKLIELTKNNPEIENISHALRIAVIRYIRDLEDAKRKGTILPKMQHDYEMVQA